MRISPLELADGYKVGHVFQYPDETKLVYSNFTPRASRVTGVDKVVFFGLQYFIKEFLIDRFNCDFFMKPRDVVVDSYAKFIRGYLGKDLNSYEHIEYLHDLGYLPLVIKAVPEGSLVDLRVPCMTMYNTDPKCYWLTNFIETILSNTIWLPCTSATTAHEYRKLLDMWAEKTSDNPGFVDFQGHDFSFRGLGGLDAALTSGMGHLLSFKGTDTIPAIRAAEFYYGADNSKQMVGCSVPATEHSVMCAGSPEGEYETFKRLITKIYPDGIVSIVSDQYDLWKVLTDYAQGLKPYIMERNGKVVFRPDSGNPVKILCGDPVFIDRTRPDSKGVVELLWDMFGGTVNSKGYKELDPHVGAIYGDSITVDRANDICKQLEAKGFASTNVVLGIGSYTYQYVTRDTFGFAVKSTYVEIGDEERAIYKDPITDNGIKKSAYGLVNVNRINGKYILTDNVTWEDEEFGLLDPVFLDGVLFKEQSFYDVINRLKGE